MQYIIRAYDGPDMLEMRMSVRPRHLKNMERVKDHVICAGGLLDDEGKPLDPVTEMLDDEQDEWLTAWTPDFADDLAERLDEESESIAPEGYWEGLDDRPKTEGETDS